MIVIFTGCLLLAAAGVGFWAMALNPRATEKQAWRWSWFGTGMFVLGFFFMVVYIILLS